MPRHTTVIDIETTVGKLRVSGRLSVDAPWGTVKDTMATYKAKSLAERIERAVNTAILNFRADLIPAAAAVDPQGDSNTGTPSTRD
jgi:hypothetical protein